MRPVGEGPFGKSPIDLYKQDFQEGIDLFKKSLNGYANADEEHKKAKFKEVMDKTLDALRDTVKASLSQAAQRKEQVLEQDYMQLMSKETDENYKKVQHDIQNLEKYS
jgi:hypothetical protein